jgi:hypothetical protein
MAKTKISEFNANPALNTDIDSINIAEGCAPSGINDAIRELMSQLKDWQSGTSNDPMVIGSSGSLTLNQGTANTVPYLNGSKVVTSGTALSFDGTNFGVGVASPTFKLQIAGANSSSGGINITGTGTNGLRLFQDAATGDSYINNFQNGFMAFSNNNTERMRLDSSGNLGLGVTPSASESGFGLQVGTAPNTSYVYSKRGVANNAYYDGAWKYYGTGTATLHQFNSGVYAWYNAPSGTAGNAITFTQAMTLDASGNLGIGTTSPTGFSGYKTVQTDATSGGIFDIKVNGTRTANFQADATNALIETKTSIPIIFLTNGTERMRIDSSGNLLVGTTTSLASGLTVTGGNGPQFSINTTTRYAQMNFYNSGTQKSFIAWDNTNTNLYVQNSSGGVYLTNTGTSWTSNSDERLKENLVPITDALTKVNTLRAVVGNFISDETKKKTPFLIAQDVKAVLPEAVTSSTLKNDETNTEYFGIAYTEVIPLLVASIKELKAINDTQAETINALTARIVALESK